MNVSLIIRLGVMMFVQYAIWGAWAPTLGNYMNTIGIGGDLITTAYSLGPISAIIAPFFLGMVADRFFDSEKVLGVLCILAGVAMMAMPSFTDSPTLFLGLLFLHALCYFPTLGLTASLSFHHLVNQEKEFPIVRVFGTAGWVVIGWIIGGMLKADASALPLYIGGGISVFLGLYSFTLPHTPPPLAGKKTSMREILGVDAFQALKSKSFVVFLLASMLIFIAFGTYFPFAPQYLSEMNTLNPAHFAQPSFEMSFGQFSEIFFMLLIPFLFVRLGVKWMLMLGMLAWVARFTLFASSAATGTFWLIMLGIAIHGICYDFFFVTGQIYIEKKTPPEMRGQIQSLLVLLTQGVGFFLGTQLSGALFSNRAYSETVETTVGGVVEQTEIFRLLPEDWAVFWWIFAACTAVFSLLFFLLFNDKVEEEPAAA